ncbi:unnamed protein product [Somion occarium]|uniref:Uncharacterized protein n=1 Tax=Somion occarium TaxID=3059160 RepID=A0ABP1DGX2_9APHY
MYSVHICALLFTSFICSVFAVNYQLSDNHVGSDFLSSFVHEAIADPTHGRVTYVDQATAVAQNLTFASGDTLIIASESAVSRHTIRSDIRHMPQGCGTWSAAWEVGDDWPNLGEADISELEGVNDQFPNTMILHTSANSNMPAPDDETVTPTGNNCNVNTSGNTGCGVQAPTADSYGPAFNAIGGGWYAMERTTTFIKSLSKVTTLGTPTTFFPNSQCDINSHFGPNEIVINLTFFE